MAAVTNSLLTIDMITRESLRLLRNSNKFLRLVRKTYDPQFAQNGWKIGSNLRIRLPNSFVSGLGPDVTIQGTNEKYVNIPLATQRNTTVGFDSADKALKLDDFARIILMPQMNSLGGQVANDLMGAALQGQSFVSKTDNGLATGNIITPDVATINRLNALLTNLETPVAGRMFICNPISMGKIAGSLQGLFNNPTKISKIYDDGSLDGSVALGGSWWTDQLVPAYTTGAIGTSNVVQVANVAGQTGTALAVTALPGKGLKAGDYITFPTGQTGYTSATGGVDAVNQTAFNDTGYLQTFVVTADAPGGSTTINIFPAITPPDLANGAVQYQTVTSPPAALSNVALLANPGASYMRNFLLHPEAVEMVSADLPMPGSGVVKASRQVWDNMSIRYLESYLFQQDTFASRIDYLYGWATVRPQFMGVLADSLT